MEGLSTSLVETFTSLTRSPIVSLSQEQRPLLYTELSQLDLEYVTQSFDRCFADLNAKAEKLDDRMEPLPREFRTIATLASLFFCSQVIEKSSGSNCF